MVLAISYASGHRDIARAARHCIASGARASCTTRRRSGRLRAASGQAAAVWPAGTLPYKRDGQHELVVN
eukprot:6199904-Pleurochrysis_carterae.AAC.5